MISELYKQLEALATSEFADIVEDAEMIPSYTGRVRKLRIILIDQTFVDVWYTADGEYQLFNCNSDSSKKALMNPPPAVPR